MNSTIFFENKKGTITVMRNGKELYQVSNIEHNKKALKDYYGFVEVEAPARYPNEKD